MEVVFNPRPAINITRYGYWHLVADIWEQVSTQFALVIWHPPYDRFELNIRVLYIMGKGSYIIYILNQYDTDENMTRSEALHCTLTLD